jgi:hypothetical protein
VPEAFADNGALQDDASVIGIIAGSLGAISALLSVGGSNPWWSLGIFALCVAVFHGIVIYGQDVRVAEREAGGGRGPASGGDLSPGGRLACLGCVLCPSGCRTC